MVTFNAGSAWLEPKGWLPNTKAGREQMLAKLDGLLLEGATDLGGALEKVITPGWVVPKRLVEDHLFGPSEDVRSNAVEVYMHRLRKQLTEAGATAEVHTVRGVGYILMEPRP